MYYVSVPYCKTVILSMGMSFRHVPPEAEASVGTNNAAESSERL
jgi:hypothetical protein